MNTHTQTLVFSLYIQRVEPYTKVYSLQVPLRAIYRAITKSNRAIYRAIYRTITGIIFTKSDHRKQEIQHRYNIGRSQNGQMDKIQGDISQKSQKQEIQRIYEGHNVNVGHNNENIWEHHIIIINWEFCQINKRKLAFLVKISSSKKNARANMDYEIRSLKGYRFGVQYM